MAEIPEVQVPSGGTGERPGTPSVGDLFWDTDLDILVIWNGSEWVPVGGDEPAAVNEITIVDQATGAEVKLSIKDGALIVTDPFRESISAVDLGATTPDPGTLTNVYIDGTGRYSVGASTLNNLNGLATLEYINTPGQFFAIADIDGGVFGPGDRQSFGLVAEDIYDGTNLRGGVAPFSGGNSGGWSLSYSWYYTGGYPYGWTTYVTSNQTPGGSGISATGTFGGQSTHRNWWELATLAGVGKSLRVGIANGTLTDKSGQNFSNRLVMQLYVSQEMFDHPQASSKLPANVLNNGVGWYAMAATAGEYENLGQFPNGKDKGYRFRWSTFGNTTLSQLPYVTGVSDNDQITSASGQSHYVVYGVNAADKTSMQFRRPGLLDLTTACILEELLLTYFSLISLTSSLTLMMRTYLNSSTAMSQLCWQAPSSTLTL